MQYFDDLYDIDQINIIDSTHEKALMDSVLYQKSIIKVPIESKFETNNISVFRICNSNESLRFIDISLPLDLNPDIISDINTISVHSIQIILNETPIDNVPKRLIRFCAPYSEIKLRLFFSILDGIPKTFSLSYNGYLISDVEVRRRLQRQSFKDGNLLYLDGLVKELQ
jgi:hypothetical protein